MDNTNKTLYLFTAEFPYGISSETFLETEISFLSKGFEKVFIIPSSKKETCRQVPPNVFVKDWVIKRNTSKTKRVSSLLKAPFLVLTLLWSEIRDKGVVTTLSNIHTLLQYVSYQLPICKQLIHRFKSIPRNTNVVLYSYWFCEYPLPIIFANKKTLHAPFVSRAHRYDLYDDNWPSGVPFRKWKIKHIDKLFLIRIDSTKS